MNLKIKQTSLAAAIALALSGCGGGGGSSSDTDLVGIGGSGFVSSGAITGFGSVYVNGVKFETDDSTFDIEGDPGTQDNLSVGMIVKVYGSINPDDGSTGTATSIVFDDELQGPVENIDRTLVDTVSFTVLGIDVVAERVSTNFDDVTFDTLANSDNVEISGFFDSTGTLYASRIEKTKETEVEIKGTITGLSGTDFTINGINVDASTASLEDLPDGLQEGILVEIEGDYDGTTITATSVESEEFELEDSDEFEVEGYITDYVDNSNFKINGISIDASKITSLAITLANDIKIEVEGQIVDGVLVAEEISQERDEVDITAPITFIDENTQSFEVTPVADQPAITIQVSNETEFEDEFTSEELSPIESFADLTKDLFVELHGYEQENGDTFWSKVTIVGNTTTNEGVIVESKVEAIDDINKTVTLLGVTFATDGSTVYEQNDTSLAGWSAFYSSVTPNVTYVEIEDTDVDGVADKIEID